MKGESLSNMFRLKVFETLYQNGFHGIDNAINRAKEFDLVGETQKLEKDCDLFGAQC